MRLRRALARTSLVAGICLIIVAGSGCSRQRPVEAFLEEPFPHKLSEWHLFRASSPELIPNNGVVPYDLNTPLFSDYADKYQTIRMERRDGILQVTLHTDGGALQWGLLPHRELPLGSLAG